MSHKILVIRLSSLGDVVLTGPVYKSIKAHWPEAHIAVLVKPQFAPILDGHSGVDEVIVWRGFSDALRRIRAAGFTHALDLHATPRSRLLVAMSGIAQRSTYQKDALARRMFVSFGKTSPRLQRHTVDRYLQALACWGVPSHPDGALHPGDWGGRGGPRMARRALVMQTSFLGDCLLTLPLLRRLREHMPQAAITVLALAKHAEVFRACEWVTDVMTDDKRGRHSGLVGAWRIAGELSRRRFDLAIIPHRSFRSSFVAWLAGVPRRVGFTESAGRFLLTDTVPFSWLTHDLERNLSLVRPLGVEPAAHPSESRYIPPRAPSAELSKLMIESGLGDADRLIGIHPGAAWPTKRWLPSRFSDLCRRLRSDGYSPILIGGSADAKLGEEISASSAAINWIGRTTLGDLSALMARLALFVTNDSGPMHLAAGAGVPVVAIFGATTRELGFFPYGVAHRVVESALSCRPCGLHGGRACPEGHFLCMRMIGVDQVHRQCLSVLNLAERSVKDAIP